MALSAALSSACRIGTLSSSGSPTNFGDVVTFTLHVAESWPKAGVPSGNVIFKDGGQSLGTIALNGQGNASFSTAALNWGSHSITAAYGGDKTFGPRTFGPITQVVNPPLTTSTSLAANPASSVYGQPLILTASVSTLNTAIPTGTITFQEGATILGIVTLDASAGAVLTISTLALGPHSITAAYSGDASLMPSTCTAPSSDK